MSAGHGSRPWKIFKGKSTIKVLCSDRHWNTRFLIRSWFIHFFPTNQIIEIKDKVENKYRNFETVLSFAYVYYIIIYKHISGIINNLEKTCISFSICGKFNNNFPETLVWRLSGNIHTIYYIQAYTYTKYTCIYMNKKSF